MHLSSFLLPLTVLTQVISAQGSFYKDSNVIELDSSNFDEVILNTNQTSLVEFYAPWCGHCQRLKPEYEKVGKHLNDIAIIGAINCDIGKNKKICSKYRVEGFPTILAFRAPKIDLNKPEKIKYAHATEVYNGQRKTKPLIDFVSSRMKNYVKRLITLEKLNDWVANNSDRPKMVVFTRKDKLTTLLKSIAVDLLGAVDFAYFPLKSEKTSVFENFEIDPQGSSSVVYFFDSNGDKHLYEGELSKLAILKYLQNKEDIASSVKRIFKRLSYVNKVQKGEKAKKPSKDHDEL